MLFIGIDPGKSGGISAVDDDGGIVYCKKFPDTERDLCDVITGFTCQGYFIYKAIIEHVHSMPKQGVASSFKFGMSYGFLRGCLIASGIAFDQVTPQKWQKYMGCLSGGDKNKTKAKAQQLFPAQKLTHATLLLAEYARRTNQRA